MSPLVSLISDVSSCGTMHPHGCTAHIPSPARNSERYQTGTTSTRLVLLLKMRVDIFTKPNKPRNGRWCVRAGRGVEGGERGFKKVPAPNTAQATIKLQVLAKWREEKERK